MVYVFTRVLRFPDNTVIAWIKDNYHEQGNIIIILLLLPLGHISNSKNFTLFFLSGPYMIEALPIYVTKELITGWCVTRTVTHDPVTNYLVTLSSLWWCITEWAQRYLSVIRSDKSQSRSVSTQQTLSEILVVHLYSHPVTLWRLAHPKHSHGIRE